jgi:hypothetical protein
MHRYTLMRVEAESVCELVASQWLARHLTQCQDATAEWLLSRNIACRTQDLDPPRRSVPIAQIHCLYESEQRDRRQISRVDALPGYGAAMIAAHVDFMRIHWALFLHTWRTRMTDEGMHRMHDVADALGYRLRLIQTKPRELQEIETTSRRILIASEELERHLQCFDLSVQTLYYSR